MKEIYRIKYGSHAYGVANKDSDIDLRSIMLPTIDEALSLKNHKIKQTKHGDDDTVFMPIQHFFWLSHKCNPSVIEWLYVPNNCMELHTPESKIIRDNRYLFLSKEIYYRFKGYAFSELTRLTKITGRTGAARRNTIFEKGFNVKSGYNVVRLLDEAIELLSEGFLKMPLEHRELYRSIREGKLELIDIMNLAEEKQLELDKAFKASKLPEKSNFEVIDRLMVKIIKGEY